MKVSIEEGEEIMMKIEEALGLTKYDFDEDGRLIYTKWGSDDDYTDVENLGDSSLKISKNLGDIYIDSIRTNGWVIIGSGTTLHCEDIEAGEEVITDYEGFIH